MGEVRSRGRLAEGPPAGSFMARQEGPGLTPPCPPLKERESMIALCRPQDGKPKATKTGISMPGYTLPGAQWFIYGLTVKEVSLWFSETF